MSSTRVKRAPQPGAAARALVRAASAVPKSGRGRSSAVTRSMSAAVFPPTSSRSTKPRTSAHRQEFAVYSVSGVHRHNAEPQCWSPGLISGAGPQGRFHEPAIEREPPGPDPGPGRQRLTAAAANGAARNSRKAAVSQRIGPGRIATAAGPARSRRWPGGTDWPSRGQRCVCVFRGLQCRRRRRGAPRGAVRLRRTRRGAGNMGPVQGVGCG